MSYIVDFKSVSTVGLESSPVVEALAGLRANEARYFMNKYKPMSSIKRLKKTSRKMHFFSPFFALFLLHNHYL